jgi:hypothetical protein
MIEVEGKRRRRCPGLRARIAAGGLLIARPRARTIALGAATGLPAFAAPRLAHANFAKESRT